MRFSIQEAQKATFEYLFELVAGLKHMLSTRVSCSFCCFGFFVYLNFEKMGFVIIVVICLIR